MEEFIIGKSKSELAARAAEAIEEAQRRVQLVESRLEAWRAAKKAREEEAGGANVAGGEVAAQGDDATVVDPPIGI